MNIQDLPLLELDTKALEEIKGGDWTKFNIDLNVDLNVDKTIDIVGIKVYEAPQVCTNAVVFYKGELYPSACDLPPEARKLPRNHPDFYGPDISFVSVSDQFMQYVR